MITSIITAKQAHHVAKDVDEEIASDFYKCLNNIKQEPLGSLMQSFLQDCFKQIEAEASKGHFEASLFIYQGFFGTLGGSEALNKVINFLEYYEYEIWINDEEFHIAW